MVPSANQPALVDDRDPVAHQLDLGEQMGRDQHGHAALGSCLINSPISTIPEGSETVGRLIEQDQPGLAEGDRQTEALLHAQRKVRALESARSLQVDQFQQVVDLGPASARARASRPGSQAFCRAVARP